MVISGNMAARGKAEQDGKSVADMTTSTTTILTRRAIIMGVVNGDGDIVSLSVKNNVGSLFPA
jgi:urease gamma subunit